MATEYRIKAMLTLNSDGSQKVAADTAKIATNLNNAQKSAKQLSATGANGLARSGGIPKGDGDSLTPRQNRGARGVAGNRGAAGRDFSGLAQASGDTNGVVAAYATLAANIFAITAAFKALSDAAKFVQLQKGLEQVGAQSGKTLGIIGNNMERISGYAISSVDALKSVASATAAGFSGKEIERLTRVAKGASTALGRDMSDAVDRLSRGTIKLEPELLDELGIMTRLDEATRTYALSHKLAASALTTTQRRQAFLNAVLAEGEMKFGDIADNVQVSTYDKLAASVKKTGTEFLAFVNVLAGPFIDALVAIPALGLIPMAGILKSAFGKLIPDMDKNIEAHSKKLEVMNNGYVRARNTMEEFYNNRVNSVDSKLTPGQASALDKTLSRRGINTGDLSRENIQKSIVALKAKERDQQNLINQSTGKDLENRMKYLDTIKLGIASLKEELRVQKEGQAFSKTLVNADVKQTVAAGQAKIQGNLAQNIYNSGGGPLGTLKAYGTAIKEQAALVGFAGREDVRVTEENNKKLGTGKETLTGMSKLTTSMGGGFKAVGGFIDTGLQGLQSFMGTMFIIMGLVQVVMFAWKYIEETFTSNTKRVKELREEMTAVQETAAKTAIEVGKLQAAGRFGQSIDAAVSSMSELYNKTKELNAELNKTKDAKKSLALGDSIGQLQVRTRFAVTNMNYGQDLKEEGVSLSDSLKEAGVSDDLRTNVINTGDLIKVFGKNVQDAFVKKTEEMKNNPVALSNYVLDLQGRVAATIGTFKDMTASAKLAGDTLSKIRSPDMFTTDYSPVTTALADMSNNFKAITETASKLGAQGTKVKAALGESIFGGGLSLVNEIGRLNGNSDEIFTSYTKVSSAVSYLSYAINTYGKDSKEAAKASDDLSKAQEDLASRSNITATAISSYWENANKVLAQTVLATKKLSLSLAESQASFMKTTASIAKVRRETELLSKVGTTKYKDAGVEEVEAAKEALNIARSLSGIKMAVIDAEYGLIEAQLKLQEITMRNEQRMKNPAIYDMLMKEKSGGGSLLDRMKANPEEVKAMEAMLSAVDMIGDQLGIQQKVRGQLKANIGAELVLEEKNFDLAKKKLDVYTSWNSMIGRYLDAKKKELDYEKQIVDARKQISDLNLAGYKKNIERQAYANNREVTKEESKKMDKMTFELALTNLQLEKDMALKEHDLKMSLLSYEFALQKATAAAQKKVYENTIGSKTASKSDKDTAQYNLDYLNAVEKTLDRQIGAEGTGSGTLRDLISQKFDIMITQASDAVRTLPTVMDDFLHDYWTPINEASKNYAKSGGNGNLLSAFDPAAGALSREIAKNAPEGMSATEIQALAVNQELFNLQLEATDKILGSVAQSFSDTFAGLIDGTMKAKDAFKSFALSIFKMIAEIMTRMMVLQALQFLMPGGFSGTAASAAAGPASAGAGRAGGLAGLKFGAAGGIMPMATGGIMDRSQGLQGVITKPTYLVGEAKYNEAVVPLPNGRAIPVQMHGGSSNKNNVQVNVNLHSDGRADVEKSGVDFNDLGTKVSAAVQKALLEQKAPGGILNKYGVA